MPLNLTLKLTLTLSLFTPIHGFAASTAAGRPAATAPQSTRVHALVGTWQATGGNRAQLTFRADGTLVFSGGELRYSTRGNGLILESDGERIEGGWRVEDGELTLTLRGPDGAYESERYRRVEPASLREAVGRASFTLPLGWTVAHRDGDVVLVNPGFAETDTLDALVVVASEALAGADLDRTVTALLEAHLPALVADLREQQVEVEHRCAKVTALALPKLSGAEVTLAGHTGGARPVTVWIGTTRATTVAATVLVVVLHGQEDVYLPGARRMLESLQFTPEGKVETSRAPGLAGLAGLEFGRSTYGSDSSLTTVYRFGTNSTVTRRTMFSSPFGGSDSEAHGTYVQNGDCATTRVDGETIEATLERGGADTTALRIGNAVHRRI